MSMNLNVELFKRLQAAILKYPEHLRMGNWYDQNCKTTACIAGWALALDQDKIVPEMELSNEQDAKNPVVQALKDLGIYEKTLPLSNLVRDRAQEKLQIEEPDRLFYTDEWPNPYYEAYIHANTKKGRAYVAATYMATYSPELDAPNASYLPKSDEHIAETV